MQSGLYSKSYFAIQSALHEYRYKLSLFNGCFLTPRADNITVKPAYSKDGQRPAAAQRRFEEAFTESKKERKKEMQKMSKSSNSLVNPSARDAMNRFKMEAASQVGVNLKQGYNGDLTSREAGSVGGEMVKRMIAYAQNNMK